MSNRLIRAVAPALTLALGATLSGCGGMPTNRSLESVHQPVVTRNNYTLDVATYGGTLSLPEQRRLSGWFDALDLRYGDRVSVDDPSQSGSAREAVAALAARYGLLVSDEAPVTAGQIAPGTARVVVSRSSASVPECPDWSTKSDVNLTNGTYSNFGCAANSNLAAMVADPVDLLRGRDGTGVSDAVTAAKAVGLYRTRPPSGSKELKESSSKGGN